MLRIGVHLVIVGSLGGVERERETDRKKGGRRVSGGELTPFNYSVFFKQAYPLTYAYI